MSSSVALVAMEDSSLALGNTPNDRRRKATTNDSGSVNKRSKLVDMVFYDGQRHPAAVLHELRPEITLEAYDFQREEISPKHARFRCTVTINNDTAEPIIGIGFGRSKQSAKNMAAQQALINLYPTYRPPIDAILTEDSDINHQGRFVPTLPPSLNNDPSLLIDSIRKHLTTKSIAIKTPLQLFNELFVHNQRLNPLSTNKNRIELIDNDENLFVVRVTAMDQQFWGVSVAKNVAQNEACQEAIETLCNVSFRNAKAEFVRALQAMKKITLPSVIMTDSNNNNNNNEQQSEQQLPKQETTEALTIQGISSSFLMPNDEIDQV